MLVILESSVDTKKVEASFVFSPTLPGQVSWLDSKKVAFLPQGLGANKLYTMTFALRGRGEDVDAHTVFTATFSTGTGGVPIPILMYHRLQELSPDAGQHQRDWTVAPANLEKQLRCLADRGYRTIDFTSLVAYFRRQEPLPLRPIIISMDDGYREVYDMARPLLAQYGFTACLFVIPAHVGYPAYLDWEQMRALRKAGYHFGSHTLNHHDLRKADEEEARRQIRESKARIEEELGQTVIAFSYPLGAHNARTIALLKEYSYQVAGTLDSGYYQRAENDGLFRLKRIRVSYETTLEDFASKLP